MSKQNRFQRFAAPTRASLVQQAYPVRKRRGRWLALVALSIFSATTNAEANAEHWLTVSPKEDWTCIAASADGVKYVAVAASGPIYTSSNSGIKWMLTSAPRTNWSAVASSADGTKLVAAVGMAAAGANLAYGNYTTNGGAIYTSTNSGITWTQTTAPVNLWSGVACSADGIKLVAVAGGYSVAAGAIYTSTNSGATWTMSSAPSNVWTSVASSTNGTKLIASATYSATRNFMVRGCAQV